MSTPVSSVARADRTFRAADNAESLLALDAYDVAFRKALPRLLALVHTQRNRQQKATVRACCAGRTGGWIGFANIAVTCNTGNFFHLYAKN
jgi:hypothetical protein